MLNHFNLATDGLSSNSSLSLWDEMRSAIYLHSDLEINELAKNLLLSTTNYSAKALGIKKGIFKVGYDADMIVLSLDDDVKEVKKLALSLVEFTKKPNEVYIFGKLKLNPL